MSQRQPATPLSRSATRANAPTAQSDPMGTSTANRTAEKSAGLKPKPPQKNTSSTGSTSLRRQPNPSAAKLKSSLTDLQSSGIVESVGIDGLLSPTIPSKTPLLTPSGSLRPTFEVTVSGVSHGSASFRQNATPSTQHDGTGGAERKHAILPLTPLTHGGGLSSSFAASAPSTTAVASPKLGFLLPTGAGGKKVSKTGSSSGTTHRRRRGPRKWKRTPASAMRICIISLCFVVRMIRATRFIRRIRSREGAERTAAFTIQCSWRRRTQRLRIELVSAAAKIAKHLRLKLQRGLVERKEAATTIQASWRGKVGRNQVKQCIFERDHIHVVAAMRLKAQRMLARRTCNHLQVLREEREVLLQECVLELHRLHREERLATRLIKQLITATLPDHRFRYEEAVDPDEGDSLRRLLLGRRTPPYTDAQIRSWWVEAVAHHRTKASTTNIVESPPRSPQLQMEGRQGSLAFPENMLEDSSEMSGILGGSAGHSLTSSALGLGPALMVEFPSEIPRGVTPNVPSYPTHRHRQVVHTEKDAQNMLHAQAGTGARLSVAVLAQPDTLGPITDINMLPTTPIADLGELATSVSFDESGSPRVTIIPFPQHGPASTMNTHGSPILRNAGSPVFLNMPSQSGSGVSMLAGMSTSGSTVNRTPFPTATLLDAATGSPSRKQENKLQKNRSTVKRARSSLGREALRARELSKLQLTDDLELAWAQLLEVSESCERKQLQSAMLLSLTMISEKMYWVFCLGKEQLLVHPFMRPLLLHFPLPWAMRRCSRLLQEEDIRRRKIIEQYDKTPIIALNRPNNNQRNSHHRANSKFTIAPSLSLGEEELYRHMNGPLSSSGATPMQRGFGPHSGLSPRGGSSPSNSSRDGDRNKGLNRTRSGSQWQGHHYIAGQGQGAAKGRAHRSSLEVAMMNERLVAGEETVAFNSEAQDRGANSFSPTAPTAEIPTGRSAAGAGKRASPSGEMGSVSLKSGRKLSLFSQVPSLYTTGPSTNNMLQRVGSVGSSSGGRSGSKPGASLGDDMPPGEDSAHLAGGGRDVQFNTRHRGSNSDRLSGGEALAMFPTDIGLMALGGGGGGFGGFGSDRSEPFFTQDEVTSRRRSSVIPLDMLMGKNNSVGMATSPPVGGRDGPFEETTPSPVNAQLPPVTTGGSSHALLENHQSSSPLGGLVSGGQPVSNRSNASSAAASELPINAPRLYEYQSAAKPQRRKGSLMAVTNTSRAVAPEQISNSPDEEDLLKLPSFLNKSSGANSSFWTALPRQQSSVERSGNSQHGMSSPVGIYRRIGSNVSARSGGGNSSGASSPLNASSPKGQHLTATSGGNVGFQLAFPRTMTVETELADPAGLH